jgi:hypothetical protein
MAWFRAPMKLGDLQVEWSRFKRPPGRQTESATAFDH